MKGKLMRGTRGLREMTREKNKGRGDGRMYDVKERGEGTGKQNDKGK